jgi:ribose 1,5-bisphosphokinase
MSGDKIGPGRLVAVVGPSGSGKDSIMRAASEMLAGDGAIVFPRRVITRAADVHEDHIPVSRAEFREAEAAGAFSMSWEAHGLRYGIPRDVDDMLGNGLTVVVNVSRGIMPLLRERYRNLTIVAVSVDPQRLAQRLTGRGRETHEEIQSRVARARQCETAGPATVEIDNNGSLQEAVRSFLSTVAPNSSSMTQGTI